MDRIDAMRLFVRLAERKSFSGAARDLKIKQSTASKWVAELEAQLGVALVQRTTRALHLTDRGHEYLRRATEVLAAFDAMTHETGSDDRAPRGRVRVSAAVVFGNRFIVPPVITFLRSHRRVEVELVLGDRYVNLVDDGFDLAVRVGIPTDTSARGRKLANGRRRLVASPSYVKARGVPRVPRDLRDHECLVHGDAATPAIWRFGGGSGAWTPVAVRGRVAVNNSESVLLMARRGLGIALLADWLVATELARGQLVTLLDDFPAPPAPVYALTPPGRFVNPTTKALVDHLAASLADQVTSEPDDPP